MALNAEQKQTIIEFLAAGKTATETATAVGCSRATVQRVKKDPSFASLMKMASGMAHTQQLSEQGSKVIETLQTMKEREPAMQEGLGMMFEGLTNLFALVLAQTSADDVSPRMLPSLAKSAADLATAYADFTDRLNGLEVLSYEVQKINAARASTD